LAKFVELKGITNHPNADRLNCVTIDYNNVIIGKDLKDGDQCVYFPWECQIAHKFLSFTNSFRTKMLNDDNTKAGFFEDACRVKAANLRGIKSFGYIVPIKTILDYVGHNFHFNVGDEFDTLNGELFVQKFVAKHSKTPGQPGSKKGTSPKLSRLIDGQVKLHSSTSQLKKTIGLLNPEDKISITYKTHGTSWWAGNLLVKKKLTFIESLIKKLGIDVVDTKYDIVYGSRKVVKNKDLEDPKGKDHFYNYDLWKDIADRHKDKIPKGFTFYGECVGFTKEGKYIQKGYDYGCKGNSNKTQIYRITFTNEDGESFDLTQNQIEEFCRLNGFNAAISFYQGALIDLYPEIDYYNPNWRDEFLECLIADYNDKDCWMCENKVPEEGIVLRVETITEFKAFKLKSDRFFEWETKVLDSGSVDIEEAN